MPAFSLPEKQDVAAEGRFGRQIELVREHWAAVRRLWLDAPDAAGARALRTSLPADFWIGCGMPGLAKIRPTRDGHFEFAEDGRPAIIVPSYDTIPGMLDANPERHVEHLVDLVAVNVDHPDRFWRRCGETVILGNAFLEIAGQAGEPITVFRTPLTWLQAAGAGVAVLDWDWVPDLLLGFDLIAEDVELGERLEAALKPNIWIGRAAA